MDMSLCRTAMVRLDWWLRPSSLVYISWLVRR